MAKTNSQFINDHFIIAHTPAPPVSDAIAFVINDFLYDNRGLIDTLKESWMMTDAEVIKEMLKLGARNECAILEMMEIDRSMNERGE